jgi:uroporphyrinogen decarboxylase
MSARELVYAALHNEKAARVPVGFWFHFTKDEALDVFDHPEMEEQNLAGHRRFFRDFHPDLVKIMSDGFFIYPNKAFTHAASAADFGGLTSIGEHHPWIDRQVALVKTLTADFGGTPSFYNLLSPATLFRFAASSQGKNGDKLLADFLAADPEAVAAGLAVVASDLNILARRVITEGKADGIYLSVKDIQDPRVGEEAHSRFIKAGETGILTAAKAAGGTNILHICGYHGNRNALERYTGYGADAFNWAVTVEGVSLGEGKKLFGGRPVIGGFANTVDGILYQGTRADVEAETRRILAEAGTTGVIVGSDCTIPRDTPTERLDWVREAAAP